VTLAVELARDLAYALDPARFARRVGIDPDPWQEDLLRSVDRQLLLLCARQTGKSTIVGIRAYYEAQYFPPALILLLSPSLRQSQELFRKVKDVHNALGSDGLPVKEESALRIEFRNGSRVVCLPGTEGTVRGYSGPRLVIFDEASRVDDELYQAVRPMLATSNGRLILLSTPFGKRGHFFHEWTEGGPAWKRVKLTAYDCPRITPEFLESERETIGDWMFRQEYLVQFVETDDQWISYDLIAQAINPDIKPFFGGWKCSS
jgi:hypothetical protein